MTAADEFREVLARAGIPCDDTIHPDGTLHRYHVDGDRASTRNGWYVLHVDGVPAAAYGSWRHGVSGTWRAGNSRLTPADRERIERAKQAEKVRSEQQAADAAERARHLWERASPAAHHDYLTAKGIQPFVARKLAGLLVLPILDFDWRLHSLQFIAADGGKKLLSGGRKSGHFIAVRFAGASRLLICEGFATGASLAEIEPDSDVIAAIDAGNLQGVAVEARRRFPALSIVICGDADPVGREKANAAAIAARALLAVPDIEGADWNDIHRMEAADGRR